MCVVLVSESSSLSMGCNLLPWVIYYKENELTSADEKADCCFTVVMFSKLREIVIIPLTYLP